MKKSLYICNAKQLDRVTRHTYDLAYSLVSKGNSFGCLATKIQGVRSLFVHTKLVRQMPNNNKQATQAKNSNLSQKTITTLIVLGALVIGTLLLIFAPEILLAFGKFLGCVALTAMAVVPMLYSLTYNPYEKR